MSHEPENRGFIIENLILAWKKLGAVREVVKRLKERKAYKHLPETVKDDIEEISQEVVIRKEE